MLPNTQTIMMTNKNIEVVAAVNCRNGHFLATQRGYGDFKGWWEFPGGKMETGETQEEALKREIREELNTEIVIDSFLTTVNYDYPNFHLTMHCYLCSLASEQLTLMEHDQAAWLAKEKLNTVNWLPADILVIEALQEI